jgi:hypothetical protein
MVAAVAGGGSFTTDGSGLGPNDSANWATGDHFGGSWAAFLGEHWTARSADTATAWPATGGNNCTTWTTNNGSLSGEYGATMITTSGRWAYNIAVCSTTLGLICLVNP